MSDLPQRFILEVEGTVIYDSGLNPDMVVRTAVSTELDRSPRSRGLPPAIVSKTTVVRLGARTGGFLGDDAAQFRARQAAKIRLLRGTGDPETKRQTNETDALLARLRQLEKKENERKAKRTEPQPDSPSWPPRRELDL